MMLISRYRDAHQATWEPVRASLMLAARTLRSKPSIVPIEVELWYSEMRIFLEEVSHKIRERMIAEDADENWRFWYDFDAGVATAARELVKRFPQHDEHKCPLIIL